MKRTWLIVMLNLVVAIAMAQKPDSVALKLQKNKGVKSATVNGYIMLSSQNIIQNFTNAKNYSVLLNAIKAAGLTETFESKGPITIFAPTNSAFSKMPAGALDTLLLPAHKYDLSSLVTYHAIAGKVSAKDISRNIKEHKGAATYITLAGSKLTATFDAYGNIILTDETGGRCVISQFDVEQSNGMLHVVDSVIVPKIKVI
ncbi:fasciclin domain-containing protein [Mucilaginibacter boryungensis]|uniref:Fasciclin domain-containing protein n=1 Tax=Mucilaginibacter boryungensis TaxID=768480 RepID=A0ABR9XJU1_9SPHI|nr:fasciclin domain-containing protein [Mucilaginibacter boryungensis]MBE9667656.1 fasciclin domain-containing protein [Mucilaginibacter boryungensis]